MRLLDCCSGLISEENRAARVATSSGSERNATLIVRFILSSHRNHMLFREATFGWTNLPPQDKISSLLGYYSTCSGTSFLTDVLGKPIGLIFKGTEIQDERLSSCNSWPLKNGPMGCPETSVMNYHYRLRNIPEEQKSHILRGGTLKSRTADEFQHCCCGSCQ